MGGKVCHSVAIFWRLKNQERRGLFFELRLFFSLLDFSSICVQAGEGRKAKRFVLANWNTIGISFTRIEFVARLKAREEFGKEIKVELELLCLAKVVLPRRGRARCYHFCRRALFKYVAG